MSWQLGSLVVVCCALAAGFTWYERSRPSSKLVAMVAVLAALAVAGRVVFHTIPNVQATTDITILSGYVLGPGPGFVVGAIGALVSNVFLGQGPWTPWQMLGWAAIGVSGAILGRITKRRLGRLPLSLACGVAGFAFGFWMDLFQTLTFAAERSVGSYLAIAATSLPFNLAHALGNFALCMLFGPAFVRLLERFRSRLEVRWRPVVTTAALIVVGLLAVIPAGALAKRGSGGAVKYLRSAQNKDGGFGGAPKQSSSPLMTGWSVLGLEAAGRNPLDVRRGGRSPIDYMRSKAGQLDGAAELSRTILAVRGAGLSVRRFAGRRLLADLEKTQRADGSFRRQSPTTAFAVMALRAAGRSTRGTSMRRALRWLAAQQNSDGGFSNGGKGGASDIDDTGAAIQALVAGGRKKSAAVTRAVGFLRGAQRADGGIGQFPDAPSNAQSSAWAAQGLTAAGRDPRSLRRGRSLIAYLSSLQQRNGGYRYSRTSAQTPVWVTGQVLAAIRRKPFPLDPVARRRTAPKAAAARARGDAVSRGATSHKRGGGASKGTGSSGAPGPAADTLAGALGAYAGSLGSPPARSGQVATSTAASDGGSRWWWLLALGLVPAALGAGWFARHRYRS